MARWFVASVILLLSAPALAHGPWESVDDCHDFICTDECCPVPACLDAICRTIPDPAPGGQAPPEPGRRGGGGGWGRGGGGGGGW